MAVRDQAVPPTHPIPAPYGWWPLAAITAALAMLMLDATVVVVALPDIRHDLNTGLGDAQWTLNAFTLPLACGQLIAGFLGDRFGRRRTFARGVLAFGVASLACGLAPDSGVLIAARAAQGASGAVIFAATLSLIAQCYRGRARGTAFGIRGAVAGAVVVLSPLLGGALVATLGWRWVFFVNLPVSAAVLAVTRLRIPADQAPRGGQRPDWGGLLTLPTGLLLLTLVLLRVGDHGWCGTSTLLMFAGAAAALAAFPLIEARRTDPMLDLSLFRHRTFTGTQLATLCTHGGFFGLLLYLSLYFQDQLGYSPMKTGLCFLAVNLPILLVSPVAGTVMDRLPARLLPGAGLFLVAAGLLLMHGLTPASGWRDLAPGLAVAGTGLGLTLPALGALAVAAADDRRLGMAAGVNTTASQAGLTLATAVYGALLRTHRDTVAGLDQLMLVAAGVTAVGAAAALSLIGRRAPAV
ncbi:MFS transporter [Streptomyces sp. NPDC052396]|uniref:MFS transporter n=1 Tax=Streptomyces sp. NPDC052396 TaxID=3365689 RepID=UPI0037D6B44E